MAVATFITIGLLLAGALVLDAVGHKTKLPRVTLLMLLGLVIGHSGFNLLPAQSEALYQPIAQLALVMVCFLLGGKFNRKFMQESGKAVVSISLGKVVGSAILVFAALLVAGASWQVALLLSAISTATAPATTSDVLQETRIKNRFTNTLIGIVALDDLWGVLLFSLSLSTVTLYVGSGSFLEGVAFGAWEILGGVFIGLMLGLPVAYLSGRIKNGEPTQLEALATIFLCAGFGLYAEVSFLLAALVTGAVISNCATHHTRAFHEIERIDHPFLILFFILAGATLHLGDLIKIGGLGVCYVIARVIGTWIGSWGGAIVAGEESLTRRWMGLSLLPQAGVAIGMAIVASEQFPQFQAEILSITIGSTVVFELVGPIATRFVVQRTALSD